jgi:hypothetical protein
MRSIAFGAVAVLSAAALSACAEAAPTTGGTPSEVSYQPSTGAAAKPGATTAGAGAKPTASTAAAKPAATTTAAKPKPVATKKKTPTSDLSQLVRLGIDINEGVLIDVADDGVDRWLQIGKKGVDFTGTTKTDSTMMSLKAAPVTARNRVLIKPPFWNEDLGDGYCVADTKGAPLKLEVCRTGRTQQIWTVVPAGDSGQFELKGRYGILRVDAGKLTTGGTGRTGLQTIPFAE